MKTALCIAAGALAGLIILIALLVWHDGRCMEGC